MKVLVLCFVLGAVFGQNDQMDQTSVDVNIYDVLKSGANAMRNTGKVVGLQAKRLFNAKQNHLKDILTPSQETLELLKKAPSVKDILKSGFDAGEQTGIVLVKQVKRILEEKPALKYIIPALAAGGIAAKKMKYESLKNAISNGYKSVKDKMGATYNAVKSKASSEYNQKKMFFYPLLKKSTSLVYNFGKDAIRGGYHLGKEAVGGLYKVKKDGVKGLVNVAKDAFDSRDILVNDLKSGVNKASQDVYRGTRTLAKDTSNGVQEVLEDFSEKKQGIIRYKNSLYGN